MPETSTPPTRGAVASGGVIAAAIAVMNVATYGFTILAARALGPGPYGGFAAVMNLLLVVSVASLALQAPAARRISARPEDAAVVEAAVRRVTLRTALVLGAVLLAAAPLLHRALRLDDPLTAVLIGLIAVPLTLLGGLCGTLQGERRWRPLALVYLAAGLPRLAIGLALLAWQPSERNATLAVLLGAIAPILIGVLALRHRPPADDADAAVAPLRGRTLVRESLGNAQALLAFFALGNLDVIVARHVLDGHDAGLYAGGLILTKAVLFLPQFVVVVAFPDLADRGTDGVRRRALQLSLGLVGALGVVGVLGAWALSGLALTFVGGAEYAEIEDRLWLFAVLGTLLAMMQLLVYALLAQARARAVGALWLGLAVLAVLGGTADSLTGLLVRVIAIDVVVLLGLLLSVLRRR